MSNNNAICTICAERYRNSDKIHAGSCGHAFHEECLFRWQEQSRTCPICRSENAVYFQLYLSFEIDGAGGGDDGSGGGGGSGQNQSQGPTNSDNNGGDMQEYENLLYEKGLYQEEIKYLNECIGALTLRNSVLKYRLAESNPDSDSD